MPTVAGDSLVGHIEHFLTLAVIAVETETFKQQGILNVADMCELAFLYSGRLEPERSTVTHTRSFIDTGTQHPEASEFSPCRKRERRETLHLFQPPRADQMPDPFWEYICPDIP